MAEDYKPMWQELGLDIEKHDALLEAVGQMYGENFLSQENRPKGMEYFDFVVSEIHGLRIKELVDARKAGRTVIGSFCVYVPEELILAIDGISVGLCAGAEFAFEKAENYVPRNTCSLIKSALGFKLAKVCPYLESSDLVVGENTCDGKKKSHEHWQSIIDNLYVMDLPQVKNDNGRRMLLEEYSRFVSKLEELSGKKIEAGKLKESIAIVNNKRKAMNRIYALRNADPAPISGLDALLISQVFFYDDPVRFTDSVNAIADELEERIKNKQGAAAAGTPRLMVAGCPMAVPNWKLPAIIEDSNAVVVGEELCTGERGHEYLTAENGSSVDEMMGNIVDRYMKIHCAVFTPNTERIEKIRDMHDRYNADGIVLYNLQFCQPYQIESGLIVDDLKKSGIPVLQIDTDYSQEDAGQLQTRVEAFVESMKG